jgi:lipopolysaccharide biosynthesis glycosyltransferase
MIRSHAGNNTQANNSSLEVRRVMRLKHLMMYSANTLYDDTPEDKLIILDHIYQKIQDVKNSTNKIYFSEKNLIYFSIFGSKYFIELLDICLRSISRHVDNPNFDILFITDEPTRIELDKLNSTKKFCCKYHLIDTPKNPIISSMSKIEIVNFKELNNYNKILYLDADTLFLKNPEIFFNLNISEGYLYTHSNATAQPIQTLKGYPTHGLMFFSDNQLRFMAENPTVSPINAGHFLFINSSHMQLHFKNVKWFMKVWPSVYFFEQSFLNSYFTFHGLTRLEDFHKLIKIVYPVGKLEESTDQSIDAAIKLDHRNKTQKKLVVINAVQSDYSGYASFTHEELKTLKDDILSATGSFDKMVRHIYEDTKKQHNDHIVLLHFAGWSCNGMQKLHFETQYINAYQLPV